MDIRIIIKIDELIKTNRAGNSKEMSVRLGISVRSVYNYINFMKSELNAPIYYDFSTKSYNYNGECALKFTG